MNLQQLYKNCLLKSEQHKGQIKIEKLIVWKNRPHIWHFWANPDELMPGDKVIAGHENLPDNHPLKTNKNAVHVGSSVSPDKLPVLGRDLGRHAKPYKTTDVTMSHKTDREQEQFPEIFNDYTPAQIETFRTLGIAAGDKNAAEFLEQLHTEYVNQMYTQAVKSGKDYVENPMSVLSWDEDNISPAYLVSEALKSAVFRSNTGKMSAELLSDWVVPIPNIPQSVQDHWRENSDDYIVQETRVEFCTEKPQTFAFMKACVDRLKLHSDYAKLADEYSQILDKYVTARMKKEPSMLVYKKQLANDKFIDINRNLLFAKLACADLVHDYNITGNFMTSFPVLSVSDIQKIQRGDMSTMNNTILRAIQLVDPDNSYYVHKYHDILDTIDLYKKIQKGARPSAHLEDNEFKCKLSTVSGIEQKRITRWIQEHWDQQEHGTLSYKIHGIYRIEGLPCEQQYKSIRQSHLKYEHEISHGKNCCQDWFYHGTDYLHAKLILGNTGGFKVSDSKTGRLLGDGIYLAKHSSKSAQYIGESFARGSVSGALLLNQASLGYVHNLTDHEVSDCICNSIQADSLFAAKGTLMDENNPLSALKNDEWIVRDANAVLPRYFIHMELI